MSLRCTLYTSTTGQKGIHYTDLKPELSASVHPALSASVHPAATPEVERALGRGDA